MMELSISGESNTKLVAGDLIVVSFLRLVFGLDAYIFQPQTVHTWSGKHLTFTQYMCYVETGLDISYGKKGSKTDCL